MNRLSFLSLCALLSIGCGAELNTPALPGCQLDSECAANQVCFPLQGCGDPGGGLVVEVQGNTRTGQLAQDFPIGDGGFSPVIDFNLLPASLVGEFLRDSAIYANTVTVRVRGQSELIPGIVRSYQATFAKPERGTYSLPVGAGHYVVTAEAEDAAVPPVAKGISAGLGTNASLSFAFAATDKTIALTGRLLKRIEPGPSSIEIPVQAAMDVQAIDPVTLLPLSQRARVSITNGDFFLFVAPEAAALGVFNVVATPRDPNSLVPSKTFEIRLPLDAQIRLQLGEFGDPLPQLQGDLKTTAGIAVAGASVYLEGPVNGGGTFRSAGVITDARGVFRVDLLPSPSDGSYLLTALPPPNSAAGVVRKQVRAISRTGEVPYLQVLGTSENPTTVVCPDKITVIGGLTRPGGVLPAAGVSVVAHAVDQLKELGNQPLPMGDSVTVTNENGHFALELDPGVYQVDFIPGEDLPRTSRVVTVRAEGGSSADAGLPSRTVDLKDFQLRKGRKVTGNVTAPTANGPGAAVNATVRYFRVSAVGGITTSLLLGDALTDDLGNYSVMLPSK